MKKSIKTAISVIAALTIMSGCSDGNKHNTDFAASVNSDLVFESYTYDVIAEVTDSMDFDIPGGKYVRYSGQGILPMDLGSPNVKVLRDSLLAMVKVEYNGNGPLPEMENGDTITDISVNDTVACGYYSGALTLTLATPRVMVWEGYREGYLCGAAHGNNSTSFLNYNMESGEIISLGSLMVENYETRLEPMIQQEVKEMEIPLLVNLKDIPVASQFEITSTGITFSYDPYMIAPYSEGTIKVAIPADRLMNVLTPQGYFLITGQKLDTDTK